MCIHIHLQLLHLAKYWPNYLIELHLDGQLNTLTIPNKFPTYMKQKQKTNLNNNKMIIKIKFKIHPWDHMDDLFETVYTDKVKSNVYRYLI